MDLKSTYNRIASDWHNDHERDDWWHAGSALFLSYLKQGSHVLDVGCGSGLGSAFLVHHGMNVEGFDVSEKMIELAKQHVPQGIFWVGDMLDLGGKAKTYDAAYLKAVLLHSPKNQTGSILSLLRKRLRAGAYVYVAVKRTKDVEEEILKEDDYGYQYERFFSYYTEEEMDQLLLSAGFEIDIKRTVSSGRTMWVERIAHTV
ncbi:MAG: class I SAM-dependent methyltransferase [Patescibacteria group bacterium]|jgi:2-polyprenyl-3-methyl-5-hydroxy-6-metoxy-1,4-benzoquinol methylase